jgi:HopA1 effector protein family
VNCEQELEQIVSEIEISSAVSFTFEGKTIAVKEASVTASTLATSVPLVAELQTMLYQSCYCRRWKQPVSSAPIPAVIALDGEFIARLSQANTSQPRWDTDWRVRRIENNGQIWAEKSGVVRVLLPGEYMNFHAPGVPLKAGGSVTIFAAKESTTLQPGLYFAFSETIMASDHLDILRFYWNIDSDGMVELLGRVSREMNRFQVPFQFKGSIYRHGYDRRDAAVLYVQRKFFSIANELVSGWAQACGPHLRDDVPLFTLRMEKGVGLAEDPGTGESFGMNRCRHVADAMWAAHVAGVPRQQQARELKRHFQKHGLDLNRPYLNPGSVDRYIPQPSA